MDIESIFNSVDVGDIVKIQLKGEIANQFSKEIDANYVGYVIKQGEEGILLSDSFPPRTESTSMKLTRGHQHSLLSVNEDRDPNSPHYFVATNYRILEKV